MARHDTTSWTDVFALRRRQEEAIKAAQAALAIDQMALLREALVAAASGGHNLRKENDVAGR